MLRLNKNKIIIFFPADDLFCFHFFWHSNNMELGNLAINVETCGKWHQPSSSALEILPLIETQWQSMLRDLKRDCSPHQPPVTAMMILEHGDSLTEAKEYIMMRMASEPNVTNVKGRWVPTTSEDGVTLSPDQPEFHIYFQYSVPCPCPFLCSPDTPAATATAADTDADATAESFDV